MFQSKKHYTKITKKNFETFLSKYTFEEYDERLYKINWIFDTKKQSWQQSEETIWEYCYNIIINNDFVLKIFSSISRNSDNSRDKGMDAIRIVPAYRNTLKPIRHRFPKVKRIGNWEMNLEKRISEILIDLGNIMKCPNCNIDLKLKRNKASGINFVGCPNWPQCEYSKNVIVLINK